MKFPASTISFRSKWTKGKLLLGLPLPVQHFRHIDAMLVYVLLVLDQFVPQKLFEMSADALQCGNAIDSIARQVKTVEVVHHGHIERRGRGAFLFVAAHVQVVMVVPSVCEPVNEPGIAMISKDYRLILSK